MAYDVKGWHRWPYDTLLIVAESSPTTALDNTSIATKLAAIFLFASCFYSLKRRRATGLRIPRCSCLPFSDLAERKVAFCRQFFLCFYSIKVEGAAATHGDVKLERCCGRWRGGATHNEWRRRWIVADWVEMEEAPLHSMAGGGVELLPFWV